MLSEAGFTDPVMDQETLVLTWRTAADALAELRSLGANADLGRASGLRTPGWRRRLEAELDRSAACRPSGRIELSFELVYGHAFKPAPRVRVAPQSTVDLADMRRMLRGPRAHPQ
jgi:malonyl-CoA O-methyltransferase